MRLAGSAASTAPPDTRSLTAAVPDTAEIREGIMRTMLRTRIDAVKGSEALKSGAMQKAIMGFIEKFKPEATYFAADLGMRSSFFVFDMTASHQLPEIAEAFFAVGCEVEVTPCMTPDDLQKGLTAAGL
jgi:hypothetical protein